MKSRLSKESIAKQKTKKKHPYKMKENRWIKNKLRRMQCKRSSSSSSSRSTFEWWNENEPEAKWMVCACLCVCASVEVNGKKREKEAANNEAKLKWEWSDDGNTHWVDVYVCALCHVQMRERKDDKCECELKAL